MKKLFLLSVTFLLGLLISLPVGADDVGYIRENFDIITNSEEQILEEQGTSIAEKYDFQVYFASVDTSVGDLASYASNLYQSLAGDSNGVLLLVDTVKSQWALHYGGQGEQILQTEGDNILWYAFAKERTWTQGIQNYLSAVEARFQQPSRLVDDANLLTDAEESELLVKLDEISKRQEFDVVLVTVNSLNGKTPEAFADDYFDYNNYGQGKNHDGILLLISMEDNDWYISTSGYGIYAVTDAGLQYISQQFLNKLSAGEYATAFGIYADLTDEFLTQAKTDKPYDVDNLPKEPLSSIWIFVSALMGLVVAWLVTAILKNQLKSVQAKSGAVDYMKKDSFKLTKSQDLFLYRNVIKQARPKPSSSSSGFGSSGGSSTHTSSSGRSHGGGGGKF